MIVLSPARCETSYPYYEAASGMRPLPLKKNEKERTYSEPPPPSVTPDSSERESAAMPRGDVPITGATSSNDARSVLARSSPSSCGVACGGSHVKGAVLRFAQPLVLSSN